MSFHMKLSHRQALAGLGALAVSSRIPGMARAAAADVPVRRGIALQMYTLRGPAKEDLAGTLAKVRAMGWKYVQWSGMPDLPADKIRAALDAAGLTCIAAHTSVESFEKDFDAAVAFWKTVGTKDVAAGGMMKDCKATLADWLRGAERLDAVGANLRQVGMRLSCHNHSFEFEKFPDDPRCKEDILLEAAEPENLCAEFDLAWVYNAGADPAASSRKYKGRCPVIHVKDLVPATDGKHPQFKPLGQGALDWKAIFPAAREAGVEWYVYEQDGGEGSPWDYTQASYDFLVRSLPDLL